MFGRFVSRVEGKRKPLFPVSRDSGRLGVMCGDRGESQGEGHSKKGKKIVSKVRKG